MVKLGVQAMAAVYQARVPWCSIVVRQAFGLAGSAMMNPTRLKYRYCWPSGDWGSLPMEGGIEAAYKRDIEAHPEPDKRLQEIRAWAEALRSPFRTAESFFAEEIIDPRDTRALAVRMGGARAAHAGDRRQHVRDAAVSNVRRRSLVVAALFVGVGVLTVARAEDFDPPPTLDPARPAVGEWVGQVSWNERLTTTYVWTIYADGTFGSGRVGRGETGGGQWSTHGAQLTLKYADGFRYEGDLHGDAYDGTAYTAEGHAYGGFSMWRAPKVTETEQTE